MCVCKCVSEVQCVNVLCSEISIAFPHREHKRNKQDEEKELFQSVLCVSVCVFIL